MSEISFELPDPAYAEHTWLLFDEHTPVASPPLGNALLRGRTASDAGELPRSLRINGYTYMRQGTSPGEGGPFGPSRLPESVEEMRAWRHTQQPRVDALIEHLRNFDPASVPPGAWRSTLDEHQTMYWGVFGPVHREAVFPAQSIGKHFQELYTQRFGADRQPDAVALLQGEPNASLERAGMLWSLSRLLRADSDLAAAIAQGRELPDSDSGPQFQQGMQALRDAFGATSEGFVEDQPTWAEDDSIPLAAIRAYAGQPDGNGPLDSAQRQRDRRRLLEAELRELAPREDAAAELLRLLPIAREILPNLEDHNYYTDLCLNAASRARWLAVGHHLQQRGLAAQPDDVFYFERDELIAALEGEGAPPPDTVARRRSELALWRSVSPPPVLGKPLGETDEDRLAIPAAGSRVGVVRGIGSSPGSYRGRARVIDALHEAETLQPGDILVTRVTTPAWTPFFGVVSALVINAGSMLSHASVVAREFGLPAVVATRDGTVRIPDGATITVDGTNGIVLIE